MQYMKAVLLAHTKEIRSDGAIVEVVVWELLEPLSPSTHSFKYRLYYGADNVSRVRYDNERGKGDHRHIGEMQEEYTFTTIDKLFDDFERDIADWG
ncbi:MAG: DUF6516 family protein [Proteobacteria bacterium]|nr:DUF6516 family protein [Pseudomonadota bacterium]